ncbi:MAG: ABC transporter ATP-binding protein [Lautropia sp.]|nr:ABC transporter ATP-binding protein [Lautropia sp.]
MLEVDRLHLHAGAHPVACGYSVNFHPGEVTAIIGPNGCGKTSLMRALFGELTPSAGHIRLNGDDIRQIRLPLWRRRFGYMPQDTRLNLDLSTLEVVMLGRLDRLRMRVDDDTVLAALNALDAVGLMHIADRPIHTLSGGQRQMALFAQVLLRSPEVMMLDEPVSALDMHHQVVLMDHLHRQTRAQQWITVVILHDLNLAAQYADKLVVLADGERQAFGPPQEVLSADLIERLYDVPVDVQLDRFGHPHVRTIRYQSTEDEPAVHGSPD